MSFTQYPPVTPRLQRSTLAVPGSNPAMFEKALASSADVVFMDCEDAVAPDDKVRARENIIAALAIKALFIALAFAGHATLWAAIAADMGVSLAVVANAMRLLTARRRP